jgi:hypothetical protein
MQQNFCNELFEKEPIHVSDEIESITKPFRWNKFVNNLKFTRPDSVYIVNYKYLEKLFADLKVNVEVLAEKFRERNLKKK